MNFRPSSMFAAAAALIGLGSIPPAPPEAGRARSIARSRARSVYSREHGGAWHGDGVHPVPSQACALVAAAVGLPSGINPTRQALREHERRLHRKARRADIRTRAELAELCATAMPVELISRKARLEASKLHATVRECIADLERGGE